MFLHVNQFTDRHYLLYPLLLILFLSRAKHRRARIVGFAFATALLFAISGWQTQATPQAAYYWITSRAWELLLGGTVAFVPPTLLKPRIASWAASLGIVAIFTSFWLIDESSRFPSPAAILPTVGVAAIILGTLKNDNRVRRALSLGPLVYIGLISYSLYLWHWPILVVARYPWSAMPSSLPSSIPWFAGGISIVVAGLSYRYVEQPFRVASHKDNRQGDGKILIAAIGCAALLITLGLSIHRLRGIPARLPAKVNAYAAGNFDRPPRWQETFATSALDVREGRIGIIGSCIADKPITFAVWGDSHADALVPVLDEVAGKLGLCGHAFHQSSTPPLIDTYIYRMNTDYEFVDETVQYFRERCPPYVLLVANWSKYVDKTEYNNRRHLKLNGENRLTGTGLKSALFRTIKFLEASGAKRVFLLRDPPIQEFDVPRALAFSEWRKKERPIRLSLHKSHRISAEFGNASNSITDEFQWVTAVDLGKELYALTPSLETDASQPVYSDNSHLSVSGAMLLLETFGFIFSEMATKDGDD